MADDVDPQQWRIIPEYERSSAIVIAPQDWLIPFPDKIDPKRYQDKAQERVNIYLGLMQTLKDTDFIIMADPSKMAFNGQSLRTVIEENLLAKLPPSDRFKIIDQPVEDKHGYGDEWTRDYFPLSLRNTANDQKMFLAYSGRGASEAILLAKSLGRPVRKSDHMEAGNFMTDSSKRCYWSAGSTQSETVRTFCVENNILGTLRYDPTGHVDLFAKIIDSKTAVVSNYQDDQVAFFENAVERFYSCTDEQIAKKQWEHCDFSHFGLQSEAKLKRDPSGETLTMALDQLPAYIKDTYGKSSFGIYFDHSDEPIYPTTHPQLIANWAEVSQQTTKLLESKGMEVLHLPAPSPIVSISLEIFKNQKGVVVYDKVHVMLKFASYTNSLVTNGKAIVPSYPVLSTDPKADQLAKSIYEKAGLETVMLPSDHLSLGAGAIHCITHQIAE